MASGDERRRWWSWWLSYDQKNDEQSGEPREEEGDVDPTLSQEEQANKNKKLSVFGFRNRSEASMRKIRIELGNSNLPLHAFLVMERTFEERAAEKKKEEKKAADQKGEEMKRAEEGKKNEEQEAEKKPAEEGQNWANQCRRRQNISMPWTNQDPSGPEDPRGRKCRCCDGDFGQLSRWSGCRDPICDLCLDGLIIDSLGKKIWTINCPVKGCQKSMTPEDFRVFKPGHEHLIRHWITAARSVERKEDDRDLYAILLETGMKEIKARQDAAKFAAKKEDIKKAQQELADLQRALLRGMDDRLGGLMCCSCCGADERLNKWSGCCHIICVCCMKDYLEMMLYLLMEHKIGEVKCRVKGCRQTMTAEECREFMPDDQLHMIDAWIKKIT